MNQEKKYQFGTGLKKRKKRIYEAMENELLLEDDTVLIYNPLAFNENRIEKTLDNCIVGNDFGRKNDNDFVLGHIWGDRIHLSNSSKRKKWTHYSKPESMNILIDDTDWENREENIRKRIDQYFKKTGIAADKCNIYRITKENDTEFNS